MTRSTQLTQVDYLGDGVYVGLEHEFQLKLMTGNHEMPESTIYLEPEVWRALERYVARLRQNGYFNQ